MTSCSISVRLNDSNCLEAANCENKNKIDRSFDKSEKDERLENILLFLK